MVDRLDPHELLAAARRSMSVPVDPDRLTIRSLELVNGQVELVFEWNDFPDLLGIRFIVPDTTSHHSWRQWAPATADEWAEYAIRVTFLEEMQTGLLYRGRRGFDGSIVWLSQPPGTGQPAGNCGPVRCPGDIEDLDEAGLSTAAGLEAALASGRIVIWTQAMTIPAREALGQLLIIGEQGSRTAAVINVEVRSAAPRRQEVLSNLIEYGITAAAERGILRLTSTETRPELLAAGFISEPAGLSYLTSAGAREAGDQGSESGV
jgi:hypothetical protein